MVKKNIARRKSYTTKNGEEKVFWRTVGELRVLDDGKMFIEMFDDDADLYVFEQKEKGKPQQPKEQSIDLDETSPF